jgi:carbonic anhydrase/acetyltransferase-like protein (isoleucine patch superfamily)
MEKHKHSIKYSAVHLQLTAFVLFVLFYFVPLAAGLWLYTAVLNPGPLPMKTEWKEWLLVMLWLALTFYAMLILHLVLVGVVYRMVPNPVTGKKVPTYSSDWLRWGIKAEIWKMASDMPLIFSFVLKTYSLRWLFFSLIGLKLDRTSMIATDVRIYDPHLLEVGKNCLLPVYSIFSGHLITGNTMYMEKITIGDNVSIGANSGFAPGVTIGPDTTLGFSTLMGMNVRIGRGCMIDSRTSIADDVTLGEHVFVGKNCFFGRKARVADGLKIPDYTNIPAKAVIKTKKDILKYRQGPAKA